MRVVLHYKGGKGSGNFGHHGRPGLIGGSMPFYGVTRGRTLFEARETAKKIGATQLMESNLKTAPGIIAKNVLSWDKALGRDDTTTTEAEIAANWKRNFRKEKAFDDIPESRQLVIQNAINDNSQNKEYQKYLDKYQNGEDLVIMRNYEYPDQSYMARRMGVTQVSNSDTWELYGTPTVNKVPTGGKYTIYEELGFAGVLRHEFAHEVLRANRSSFEHIQKIFSTHFDEIEKSITSYAKKNMDEMFCESFAIITSTKYNRNKFPSWFWKLEDEVKGML